MKWYCPECGMVEEGSPCGCDYDEYIINSQQLKDDSESREEVHLRSSRGRKSLSHNKTADTLKGLNSEAKE